MNKLTVADLVKQIAQLGTTLYPYVNARRNVQSRSHIQVVSINGSEGPITFRTILPNGRISERNISRQKLAKIAYICTLKPYYPLHIDRIFSAGGNDRSALETLLAYTPHFFICYPQRVDVYSGEIVENLKHIMWCPNETHERGVIGKKEYDGIITEVELGSDFSQINLTTRDLSEEFESIEVKRTHVQMQIALIEIGKALEFMTWVAKNDRSIQVENTTLGQLPGVMQSLDEARIFYKPESKQAATLIDCIWFTSDGDHIPAVIEIEHSTGVTPGLTRMRKLKDTLPSVEMTFVIVAPDDQRSKVISEAQKPIYRDLKVKFMPYSNLRELYGIIRRYALAGFVDHRFVQAFMEQVV